MHTAIEQTKKYHLSAVIEHLQKRNDAYALLDGAVEEARSFLLQCFSNGIEAYPLVQPKKDKSAEACLIMPHLVRFDAGGRVAEYCQSKLGENIFILLQGDEDIHKTLKLLAQMLWVRLPGNEKPAWFRFYAPNIFPAFLKFAQAEHLAAVFAGSLKTYWVEAIPGADSTSGQSEYVRPVEDLECFTSPFTVPPPASTERLAFQPEHLDKFEEARFKNFTVNLCRRIAAQQVVPDAEWPGLRGQVEEAINTAEEYGITSFPCMCLYVDIALRHGWNFACERPELRGILTKLGVPDNIKYEAMQSFIDAQICEGGNTA